jgi:hypothetical protein
LGPYKIVDDYGYCVAVDSNDRWIRDALSNYVMATEEDYCSYWQFEQYSEGKYLLKLKEKGDL